MERDAAHQRWMESLTTLELVLLPLSFVAATVAILLLRQRRTSDPRLLIYMVRLQLRQAEQERELWHALATMQRRGLSVEESEVIIFKDEGG